MFQLEKYPQLYNSFVYLHRDKDRNRIEERDRNTREEALIQQRRNHPERVTEKTRLTALLTRLLSESQSRKEFHEKIQSEELELYSYRGKIKGVRGKRKYRFSSLGITREQLRALDQLERRLREMGDLSRDDEGRELD